MLTKRHQMLIVIMMDKAICRKDVKTLYTNAAFYRAIAYLRRHNIITSQAIERDGRQLKMYSLTFKGIVLGQILADMNGVVRGV